MIRALAGTIKSMWARKAAGSPILRARDWREVSTINRLDLEDSSHAGRILLYEVVIEDTQETCFKIIGMLNHLSVNGTWPNSEVERL